MGHNYGSTVSPRADVVQLRMVDSFDKRHLEWLANQWGRAEIWNCTAVRDKS